jgi:hypothetical protein
MIQRLNALFNHHEDEPVRLAKNEPKFIITPELTFCIIMLSLIGLMMLFFLVAYAYKPQEYYNYIASGSASYILGGLF